MYRFVLTVYSSLYKLTDYSHEDITVWIASVCVKTEGTLDCLQNTDLRQSCEIWRADSGGWEDCLLQGLNWAGLLKR